MLQGQEIYFLYKQGPEPSFLLSNDYANSTLNWEMSYYFVMLQFKWCFFSFKDSTDINEFLAPHPRIALLYQSSSMWGIFLSEF